MVEAAYTATHLGAAAMVDRAEQTGALLAAHMVAGAPALAVVMDNPALFVLFGPVQRGDFHQRTQGIYNNDPRHFASNQPRGFGFY